jgi:N-acetyl-gamma-glutamyl-phosphate reductase
MTIFKKVNAGILGNTGMAGRALQGLLAKHPLVEVVHASSGRESGKPDDALKRDGELKHAELVFLALPPDVSLKWAPNLLDDGKLVIDLSRAYRLGQEGAVYGLPEKNRDNIRTARFISNPGCYATSVELALLHIHGFVERAIVVADSGISGAGKQPTGEDNITAYKTGRWHDHVAEMELALGLSGIVFAPKVIENLDRGILSTVCTFLKEDINVVSALENAYSRERFIRVKRMDGMDDTAETKHLVGTNYCELSVWQQGRTTLIHSALDNLMKGAAGQAVQNMNIMCGFDEELGLVAENGR